MRVHARSSLVPLSRNLTTSCGECASRGAQASVLCVRGAPQNPGRSRLPQHALHTVPFDEWRVGTAAALAVYLFCCIHGICFAIFQGKLSFEVDFFYFSCEGGEINYQPCILLLLCRSEVARNFLMFKWLSKTIFLNVKLMCSGNNVIQGPGMNIKLHLLPQGLVGF